MDEDQDDAARDDSDAANDLRRRKNAVSDSEARFRAVFENSGAGVVITRGDSIISYVNHAFARMLDYAPEELIGQHTSTLTPPEYLNQLRPSIEALRNGSATAINIERTYLRRDGSAVWAKLSVHVLPLPGMAPGAPENKLLSRYVGVTQDITDRKLAEAASRESQRLLEEAQRLTKIGHWSWVPGINAMTWSDELYRTLGLEPGSIEADTDVYETFVVPEDLPGYRAVLNALMSGQDSASVEYRLRAKTGEVRDVIGRSISERAPDGSLKRLVGTVQDITERKRTEATLRQAMVNAEAANSAKTRFLASMSHELRTPLNAILGFAQLLAMETRGPLTSAQTGYVANIMQGGEHLLRLISDVLDLARIDTGKLLLNITPVSLGDVVRDTMEEFKPMADARFVSLSLDETACDGMVLADQMRVAQVVVNLTSNAIKYNRNPGTVTFAIRPARAGVMRLTVEDTGRGIPADRHDQVFDSFNRLGAEASGEEGTGIGLTLCKRLVEQMGGAIGFTSAVNKGTTFWVDLPGELPLQNSDKANLAAPLRSITF